LHQILTNELKPDTLWLNMTSVKFEQDEKKVMVHFENGESDSADVLIGADGIHSVVRKQMFPEIELRYSGYTARRGVVETENEAALGLTSELWGRGARFGIVRVDRKRCTGLPPKIKPSVSRQRVSRRILSCWVFSTSGINPLTIYWIRLPPRSSCKTTSVTSPPSPHGQRDG
jgi:hypothetical protein